MLTIVLSELQHNFILMKWGWTTSIFFYFMVSGTCSLVIVHQPPVLTTALGENVTMQCQLNISNDEKMLTVPVLYWERLPLDSENPRLWSPSGKYEGRVDLLDKSPNSTNKSIILRNVQWADSGRYLCKLSITTERDKSFRRKGNQTYLIVYGAMIFNLTSHNDSLLRCQVNVSLQHDFVLSIFHDGCNLQSVDSALGNGDAALPYVTLSKTVSLKGGGKYECQLHLNEELITKSIFHYPPPGSGVYSEPWLLYGALLLVPVTVLLGMVTVLLIRRP
ncbi:uncharacterized protein [Trachinotus anak]|uniref:uncharacterized protein isoform X2 n=1 Tax=Trachinotus anak TaxID=443729 RepID=UPI0039F24BA1